LGLEISYIRDEGILRIGQTNYTKSILEKFYITNGKTSDICLDHKLKILY